MTWETTSNGDVVITISGDRGTSFRSNGMGSDLTRFTVNGQPASTYFRRKYTNGATTYTLELINRANRPADGATIVYQNNGNNTEWQTSGNNNAWGALSFSYTYGSNCTQLDVPTIASIDANKRLHIATPTPTGANTYDLEIYRGTLLVYTGRVNDNGVIPFTTTNSGTYTVYARAASTVGGILSSEQSEPYDWVLTVPPLVNFPLSPFCQKQIASGDGGVQLTIETDQKGRIIFTLSSASTNRPTWRDKGVKLEDVKLFGQPCTTIFNKTIKGDTLILEPTAYGKANLCPGDPLTHDAYMEWYVDDAIGNRIQGNGYTTVKFNYAYGSACTPRINLPAPVLTDLQPDGTVTFSPSANADGYLYRVYYNGDLMEEGTIASGQQIPFHSYIDRTYDVVIVAVTNSGSASAESNALPWTLTADLSYLPASPLCMEPFGTGSDNMAELTWETDADGNVVIMISGELGTSFRGSAMGANLNDFTVEGRPASDYFDPQYSSNDIYYKLVLRDPAIRPAIGEKIRYRGSADYVEWRTPNNNNAYAKFNFDYIYGTSCPKLGRPEIASISQDGVLTLVEDIAGAGSYEVAIYRGELKVYAGLIQNGGLLDFVPNVSYLYSVQVRAQGEGAVPSEFSLPYAWHQVVLDYDLPQSEVCDLVIDANRHLTLSAETTPGDSIVFTLHGGARWRNYYSNPGLDPDNMTVFQNPADNFFEWLSGYEGDSVLILIPRPSAKHVIFHGDVLMYAPTLYYSIDSVNPSKTLHFSYTYGSTCAAQRDRLMTPVIQSLTDEGVLTFASVTNAGSYEVMILDAEGDILVSETVVSGDELSRERMILGGYTYCVKIRAIPTDASTYRPSYWSDCTDWVPSLRGGENPQPQPEDTTAYPPLPDKPEPTYPTDPAVNDSTNHDFPSGPDTIPVVVVDTLADDTDPIPPLPDFMDAEVLFEDPLPRARKVIENGQVFIYIDDRKYNLWGQLVK